MRGAPQSGLARLMVWIRSRISRETVGLPVLPCLTVEAQKKAEPFAVPADNGLRFDDDQSGSPIGPDTGQPRPKHTVHHGQLRPLLGGAPEHTDLMPKRQDLHLEGGARAEDRRQCEKKRTQDTQHRLSQSPRGRRKPNNPRMIEIYESHSRMAVSSGGSTMNAGIPNSDSTFAIA